ncbi:MAG TPA: flagellar basal body rod protein FlgC [Phycisphaerales bacterium]|nr:flagellar basal body rod protein FlgC [Phycisphaerales bacterium]
MYGALDISVSGMIAQRARLTAISANIANRTAVHADGTPYRARHVIMAPGDPTARDPQGRRLGVHVSEIQIDQTPFRMRWAPNDPRAIKDGPQKGYVQESNVNPVMEQVNQLEATRAYEANAVAAEATKAMIGQALRLLG